MQARAARHQGFLRHEGRSQKPFPGSRQAADRQENRAQVSPGMTGQGAPMGTEEENRMARKPFGQVMYRGANSR